MVGFILGIELGSLLPGETRGTGAAVGWKVEPPESSPLDGDADGSLGSTKLRLNMKLK